MFYPRFFQFPFLPAHFPVSTTSLSFLPMERRIIRRELVSLPQNYLSEQLWSFQCFLSTFLQDKNPSSIVLYPNTKTKHCPLYTDRHAKKKLPRRRSSRQLHRVVFFLYCFHSPFWTVFPLNLLQIVYSACVSACRGGQKGARAS